jgi:chemotaxis receptor (MCP) glutamine deamidase CheD
MTGEPSVHIQIGELHASRRPVVIKTVLGSCIAACLRDPVARVGGMNHFMLPVPTNGDAADLARFGIHAMELLIGEIQKLGGERDRLEAKVFGGGHVLEIPESPNGVPQQNIRFIREFLATEGICIVAHDMGGRTARQIQFYTGSGKVLLKRIARNLLRAAGQEQAHERQAMRELERYGNITLFDD